MMSANHNDPATEVISPWSIDIDLVSGAMRDPDRVLVRKPSDMRGYYKDAEALERLIAQGKNAEAEEALTVESLRAEYRKLLEKYFGPAMVFEDVSDLEGLRVPHFYRAFYVYKYATGISASISLAERVLTGGTKELEDYFTFLKSGGSRYPIESLRVAGVDMESPEPVRAALAVFARQVAELKKLLA